MINADALTTIIRRHLAGDPAVTVDDCYDVLAVLDASPIDDRLCDPYYVLAYPGRLEQLIREIEGKYP